MPIYLPPISCEAGRQSCDLSEISRGREPSNPPHECFRLDNNSAARWPVDACPLPDTLQETPVPHDAPACIVTLGCVSPTCRSYFPPGCTPAPHSLLPSPTRTPLCCRCSLPLFASICHHVRVCARRGRGCPPPICGTFGSRASRRFFSLSYSIFLVVGWCAVGLWLQTDGDARGEPAAGGHGHRADLVPPRRWVAPLCLQFAKWGNLPSGGRFSAVFHGRQGAGGRPCPSRPCDAVRLPSHATNFFVLCCSGSRSVVWGA